MSPIVSVSNLRKTYDGGFTALKGVDLEIREGEIFALLGPNGAGKTTLIGIICGLVRASGGSVTVAGHDVARDYRAARKAIGLVPQEIMAEMFEPVLPALAFSRGLFGLPPDPAHLERVLRDLSLWDKRASKINTLSGGMKRRVLIAKALAHEPRILFLDEPTAGVDVELRRDMWRLVRRLRDQGVTVILTTHYIEEAEEMADRVGVINRGEIVLVEEKSTLMRAFGRTKITVTLPAPLAEIPPTLADWPLSLSEDRLSLSHVETPESGADGGAAEFVRRLALAGVGFQAIDTARTSLEDIFVDLVGEKDTPETGAGVRP